MSMDMNNSVIRWGMVVVWLSLTYLLYPTPFGQEDAVGNLIRETSGVDLASFDDVNEVIGVKIITEIRYGYIAWTAIFSLIVVAATSSWFAHASKLAATISFLCSVIYLTYWFEFLSHIQLPEYNSVFESLGRTLAITSTSPHTPFVASLGFVHQYIIVPAFLFVGGFYFATASRKA